MRATTLALLATCFAALPATADWLVMRDGTRVETRGAWTEKGRLIVFTTTTGSLASLRADAVDLEASRRATTTAAAAAQRPAAEPDDAVATAPREVRRITNADIPAGRPVASGGGAADEEGTATPAATAGQLRVGDTAQQIDPFDSHLVVTGTLANLSQQTAAAVELTVQAYGADGELLGAVSAALGLSALRPGATTSFEAHFPDIYGSAMALRFAPRAEFLETMAQDPSATTTSEPDDDFEDFGELDELEDGP